MNARLFSVICLGFAVCRPAGAMPLSELERGVTEALAVQIAEAEVARNQALLNQRQAEQGLKLYGNAGLSNNYSIIDVGRTRNFQAVSGQIGVRLPLFGSRVREELEVLSAAADVAVSAARRDLAHQQVLLALRRRYVEYWVEQRKIALSQSLLEQEDAVRNFLDKRRDTGLLLEADRREFLTAFALARRNLASSTAIRSDDLALINLVTGRDLDDFVADYPMLPAPCLQRERLLGWLAGHHPELVALRAISESRRNDLQFAPSMPVESGISVSEAALYDFQAGDTGHATVVSIDFRMPLDYRGALRAHQDQAAAALSKARLELDLRGRELQNEVLQLLHGYPAHRENQRFANERLAAADEALRERGLRAETLPGEVLEQRQQARLRYYQVAMEAVEAEAQLLDDQARLLSFAPIGCGGDPEDGARQSGVAAGRPRTAIRAAAGAHDPPRGLVKTALTVPLPSTAPLGVYVWDARPFLLSRTGSDSIWSQLRERGIRRLLLSFTQDQLDGLATATGQARLLAFIRAARERNITTVLLLGEPRWILPAHRGDLIAIIAKLRSIPFAGLHLDLEPNQLDEKRLGTDYLLCELLATLRAVKYVSPWPVALSLHPRYIDSRLGSERFGQALERLGLQELSLMLYVTNPQRVVAIAAPILEAYPKLRFTIAQSIEDRLPPEESYFSLGFAKFQRRMRDLQDAFKQANFAGILVQAWLYYNQMTP